MTVKFWAILRGLFQPEEDTLKNCKAQHIVRGAVLAEFYADHVWTAGISPVSYNFRNTQMESSMLMGQAVRLNISSVAIDDISWFWCINMKYVGKSTIFKSILPCAFHIASLIQIPPTISKVSDFPCKRCSCLYRMLAYEDKCCWLVVYKVLWTWNWEILGGVKAMKCFITTLLQWFYQDSKLIHD